jgi:hypothetical protein
MRDPLDELHMGAPCVLASERAAHPDDERYPAKPSDFKHAARASTMWA